MRCKEFFSTSLSLWPACFGSYFVDRFGNKIVDQMLHINREDASHPQSPTPPIVRTSPRLGCTLGRQTYHSDAPLDGDPCPIGRGIGLQAGEDSLSILGRWDLRYAHGRDRPSRSPQVDGVEPNLGETAILESAGRHHGFLG